MSSQPELIAYKKIRQFEGKVLTVNEGTKFDVKRIYWINYDSNEPTQSEHAQKTLEQIIVAISGVVKITLESQSGDQVSYQLDDPSLGLYIPPLYWKRIEYNGPSILLSFASDVYNESDYIRQYEDFKRFSKK